MYEHMTTAKRIRAAKAKTDRVVDHLLYLLALHENNAIIVYSDTLSSQIGYARAGNAFEAFRSGLYHFEIVRLCALWDPAKDDKKSIPTEESIPTIIELIDLNDAIDALVEQTRKQWRAAEDYEYARKRAQEARNELRQAIKDARKISKSSTLRSTMNIRHKHLAHSLARTKHEKKTKRIPRMKYGYERKILLETLPIVETLHRWVSGKSFSFENSRGIARNNAEALWKRCTFDIER
jgi:AbiU2